MEAAADFARAIGMGSSPWVIRAYITLLFTCLAVIVLATFRMPSDAPDGHPMAKLLTFGMDSFKIVLGAVLGAMSASIASH